jgi:hypothetical protein
MSPTTTSQPDVRVRASDAEREATVAHLHHALGEGRLDLAETETRVAAAYAATYRDELPPLLADVPTDGGTPSGAPAWAAIWTSIVWRVRILAWGADRAGAPPSSRQLRLSTALAALAVLWFVACAFVGAAVVGA